MIGSRHSFFSGLGALTIGGPAEVIASQESGKSDRAAIAAALAKAQAKQKGKTARTKLEQFTVQESARRTTSWLPIAIMGGVLVAMSVAFAAAARRRGGRK